MLRFDAGVHPRMRKLQLDADDGPKRGRHQHIVLLLQQTVISDPWERTSSQVEHEPPSLRASFIGVGGEPVSAFMRCLHIRASSVTENMNACEYSSLSDSAVQTVRTKYSTCFFTI
ncbi:hypothetical protein EYF80_059847 [Liparis tanakae]|uniref:Uncharacterized protein n=1 Tax=Liparis tanakae TaxID=230148 RepID=A0A4Z2EN53_9TELE|nr:hypothetical protein EYF80_059847 [Liparis tanakae]